jgi:hypothetical protein
MKILGFRDLVLQRSNIYYLGFAITFNTIAHCLALLMDNGPHLRKEG